MLTKILIGAVAGGALGLGCYKLVGCSTGACPLTSNPWITTAYGMIVGAVLASSFR
jgi:Family of unknown function (DUF6132)